MPSSGARSGTNPSRSERGAGTGGPAAVKLKCGHETYDEYIVKYPGGQTVYRCPEGCGLVKRKR